MIDSVHVIWLDDVASEDFCTDFLHAMMDEDILSRKDGVPIMARPGLWPAMEALYTTFEVRVSAQVSYELRRLCALLRDWRTGRPDAPHPVLFVPVISGTDSK